MNARLYATVVRNREAMDAAADAILSLENRARILAQSKATRDGHRADPPPRPALSLDGVRADFDRMFGVPRA